MSKIVCCSICGNLGDSLLLTPIVEGIKRRYPKSLVYCYGHSPQNLSLWEHNPHIAGVISNPGEVLATKPEDYKRLINDLDQDEVIISTSICNRRLSLRQPRRHVIDALCNMVGVPSPSQRISIYLSPQEEAFARKTISRLGPKVALLHTTSFSCRNKEWYPERWLEVVGRVKKWGYQIIQIGTDKERPIEGTINLLGGTSLREALALIKYADFLMGIDAVFNHATSAWGKKSVVLFGATTPEVWGYSHNINIYKGLKCQPCMDLLLDACQVRKCMQQITVDEVVRAVGEIICLIYPS